MVERRLPILWVSVLFCVYHVCVCSPTSYSINAMLVTAPGTGPPIFQSLLSSIQLAVDVVNNRTDILPDTSLSVLGFYHFGSAAVAVDRMLRYVDEDISFVIGNYFVDVVAYTASVGKVFDIAQFAGSVSSPLLSNDRIYPYFSRLAPPATGQSLLIRETILHYASIQGKRGWDKCAVISTTDPYGVGLSADFISVLGDEITVATYQQFIFVGELDGTKTDITVELREIKNSGARIIVALVVGGYEDMIIDANEKGLVGENYVWIVGDAISGVFFYNEEAIELSRGLLGTFQYIPENTPEMNQFLELWYAVDPDVYFGAGGPLSPYYYLTYDMVITAAILVDEMDKKGMLDTGERISGAFWTEVLRKISFDGVTGSIAFDSIGDRIQPSAGSFFDPDTRTWKEYAYYDGNSYTSIRDIVWFSNTTEIPDLDIREAFYYWSCEDGEKGFDSTGKTISRQTPDGSNVDEIDIDYHCDHFIDCRNISDESNHCGSNYVVLFIVFAIIASPVFLLILLASMIVGYSSIYAWFGKPHPVACGFQPWLLGLSSVSMIAALCAKNFRIWRIFRKKMKKQIITNFELIILWGIMMLPVVVILVVWTIVSTPTAKMKYIDGADHYVCATGGFTGEPGGLVFFFILVAYSAFILMAGVFLSIVTRKVPSLFNESKLLAISIYNLGFLGVVIIPVYLVVFPLNPFVAWILRTCAILYGFTATLVLQFAPPVFGLVIIDKFKNVKTFKSAALAGSGTTGNSKSEHSLPREAVFSTESVIM